MQKKLIDFVAGTHGHFLEVVLNNGFGITPHQSDPFTKLGTSHKKSLEYNKLKLFQAGHWSEHQSQKLHKAKKIISIKFLKEDLLLVSSISLLRAGDMNIDNDLLEIDTFNKLNNLYYHDILFQIIQSYPELTVDKENSSIPRNILREFFKYGFANPNINGYWVKHQKMIYPAGVDVFNFKFDWFYDLEKFVNGIRTLEKVLGMQFDFSKEFFKLHEQFLKFIIYKNHTAQCDDIIKSIISGEHVQIPSMTLLQESYINGKLEVYYKKEMPFHNLNYFTFTKDVLNYLKTQAPDI